MRCSTESLQLLLHVMLLQLFYNKVHATRKSPPRFLFPEGERRKTSVLKLVYEQLAELKLEEYKKGEKEDWDLLQHTNEWDITWSWGFPPFQKLGPLKPHHRVNHIPGSGVISIKNQIFATATRLQNQYGQGLFEGIVPRHFVMPQQADEFESIRLAEPETLWILKSQNHRGVRFFDNTKSVKDDKDAMEGGNMIAQCVDPFLVGGYKFDIGVFVLVASLEPLRIFIHNNSKLRFCQLPYPDELNSQADPDSYRVAPGHRFTPEVPALKKYFSDDHGKLLPPKALNTMNEYEILKKYMEELGVNSTHFETTLHQRIVRLVAGIRPALLHSIQEETQTNGGTSHNFFELFRFDFVVDSSLQPVLMEVNISPNMVPTEKDGMSDEPAKANVLLDALRIVLAEPVEDVILWEGDNNYSIEEAQIIRQAMAQNQVGGNYKMVVSSTSSSVKLEDVFMKPMDRVQWDYFAKKKMQQPNSMEIPELSTQKGQQKVIRGLICIGCGVALIMFLRRKRRVKIHAK